MRLTAPTIWVRTALLGRLTEVQPAAPGNSWAFSDAFIDKNPEFVQRFVSDMLDGYEVAYSDEGRKELIDIAKKTTLKGEDPEVAPTIYDWYRNVGYWPKRGEVFDEAGYGPITEYWAKNNVIDPNPPAFDQIWNTSFWENA